MQQARQHVALYMSLTLSGSLPLFRLLDSALAFPTVSELQQGSLASKQRPTFSCGPELWSLFGLHQSSDELSHPKKVDYPRKQTLIRLKQTKQLWCESTLRRVVLSTFEHLRVDGVA